MKFDATDLAQYIKDHEAVWPEMQQALVECGWHNYSLFFRADGFAIGYYETEHETHQQACDAMGKQEVNTKWQNAMKRYTASGVRPDEAMQELTHYFYLGTDQQRQ